MAFPVSRPSRSIGCTTRSFFPSSDAFFIVATTVPITRPRIMASFLPRAGDADFTLRVEIDSVHDADDGGVHRPILAFRGVARRTAGDDQHGFAKSRVDRVHGDDVTGFVSAFRRDRLNYEERFSFKA